MFPGPDSQRFIGISHTSFRSETGRPLITHLGELSNHQDHNDHHHHSPSVRMLLGSNTQTSQILIRLVLFQRQQPLFLF